MVDSGTRTHTTTAHHAMIVVEVVVAGEVTVAAMVATGAVATGSRTIRTTIAKSVGIAKGVGPEGLFL
jgi:hypothetical protein